MKILELFAGSCSFSNVAKELGHETFTTDIKQFGNIDYVCDIMDFKTNKALFIPDIIWASPPCTTFSIASVSKHWNRDYTPKTKEAEEGIRIIRKTMEIVHFFQEAEIMCSFDFTGHAPDSTILWYIENPRGMLRKLGLIDGWRKEVCYCQYGDNRMKPTDIWTNNFNWIPRTMCHNNNKNCHHEPAPRGSRTGTQGIKGSYGRSKVPRELCLEILESS